MKKHSTPLSRRRFLTGTGAAAASTLAFPSIVRAQGLNEKLDVALIGVGGRGGSHVSAMSKLGENITALVDVNSRSLDGAKTKAPKAPTYRDFRKMYDDLDSGKIKADAVVVSTTEHTHAHATLPALKLKKHVYCEKPLTRDVFECRTVTEAAAEAGVITQMGTQIHAGGNYRRVVELIQSGAIGKVSECHVWVNRAWGLQTPEEAKANKDGFFIADLPSKGDPVPPELDWDLWIGPAPFRDFSKAYFPGPRWYRWWDFGNGTMSDLGSHWNDLPFWALELDAPLTIEAEGPPPHPEIAPASMRATYTYGARGNHPPCKVTWTQGATGQWRPPILAEKGIEGWGSGVLFVGENGKMLISSYGGHKLLPEADFAQFTPPKPTIEPSPGQQAEWVRAIKGGPAPLCPFSYSGPLTEANHLGNVAYRSGKKLEWDAKSMKIPNAPDAEQYLKRDYRPGWELL